MVIIGKKASAFVNLIVFGLVFLIFIFSAPMLYSIISVSVSGQGTATAFVMKSFLWIILLVLLGFSYSIFSGNEGFFT